MPRGVQYGAAFFYSLRKGEIIDRLQSAGGAGGTDLHQLGLGSFRNRSRAVTARLLEMVENIEILDTPVTCRAGSGVGCGHGQRAFVLLRDPSDRRAVNQEPDCYGTLGLEPKL